MQRLRVIFKGRVQGVGFRYSALRASQSFAVTGFVKNLDNGDVELVAEGDSDTIAQFIEEIERIQSGHIVDRLIDKRPASGEFTQFQIER